jgi:adenylate cyclase, class 2
VSDSWVHEVEVKYRVDDLAELLAAVDREGVALGPGIVQDDQAYAPSSWSPGASKIGVPFARLRTEAGRHLFTVKVPQDNELACLERETIVADREAMHEALQLMGFMPTVKIRKTRRVGSWGDATICIDVVDGLGVFVELERMVPACESGTGAQAELDARVRRLGVAAERVDQTYDSLLRLAVAAGRARP